MHPSMFDELFRPKPETVEQYKARIRRERREFACGVAVASVILSLFFAVAFFAVFGVIAWFKG